MDKYVLDTLMWVDRSRLSRADSVRGMLVTVAVVLGAFMLGSPKAAIPLSIGAVFVSIAEQGLEFGSRWRAMLTTVVCISLAGAAGAAVSESALFAVVVCSGVALLGGVAGYRGSDVAVAGLLALVVTVIYAGIPVSVHSAPTTAGLLGLGGAVQLTIYLLTSGERHPAGEKERSTTGDWRGFLGYGLRMSVIMAVAVTASLMISFPHPYWLPMTVAWMGKPERGATRLRVVQRLAGTLVGVLTIAAFEFFLKPGPFAFMAVALLGACLTIALIWANYTLAVVGVTLWILGLFGALGDGTLDTLLSRLAATGAAALLVLMAAHWLWPRTAVSCGERRPSNA